MVTITRVKCKRSLFRRNIMKHIRKYKIFESKLEINQNYIDVLDIIQFILDDFNINKLPPEAAERGDGEMSEFLESNTGNKYWAFAINNSNDFTSDLDQLDKSLVNELVIYNVWREHRDLKADKDELMKALNDEAGRIEDATGKSVNISYDPVATDLGDIVIKLDVRLDDIYDNIMGSIDSNKFKELNDNQKKEVIELVRKLKAYL